MHTGCHDARVGATLLRALILVVGFAPLPSAWAAPPWQLWREVRVTACTPAPCGDLASLPALVTAVPATYATHAACTTAQRQARQTTSPLTVHPARKEGEAVRTYTLVSTYTCRRADHPPPQVGGGLPD